MDWIKRTALSVQCIAPVAAIINNKESVVFRLKKKKKEIY